MPKQIAKISRKKNNASLLLKNKALPVLTATLTLFLVWEPGEDGVSIETRSPCFSGCRAWLAAAGSEEQA